MRPARNSRQAIVRRPGVAPFGSARRHHRLGRPLVAGIALLAILGALGTVRSLLAPLDGAAPGSRIAWPTAVAGDLIGPGFGPVLVLPGEREAAADGELEAALARLKGGPFGVVFEPVGAAPAGAATAAPGTAEARLAPVVTIDAARPPLRLDIMGLGTSVVREAPAAHDRDRLPETAP